MWFPGYNTKSSTITNNLYNASNVTSLYGSATSHDPKNIPQQTTAK